MLWREFHTLKEELWNKTSTTRQYQDFWFFSLVSFKKEHIHDWDYDTFQIFGSSNYTHTDLFFPCTVKWVQQRHIYKEFSSVERPFVLITCHDVCMCVRMRESVVWSGWWDWRGARVVGASTRPPQARRARRWYRPAPDRLTQRFLTHTTPTQLNERAEGKQPNTTALVPFINLSMTTFSTPSYDALFAPGSPVYYPARWLMTLRLSDIHPWSLLAYIVFAWPDTVPWRLSRSLSRYSNDLSLIVTCHMPTLTPEISNS